MITGLMFGVLTRMVMQDGGARSTDGRSALLRMRYPIETIHLLPGRVRFRAPMLVGRARHGDRVADALGRIQGVRHVKVDARSGSVLIEFDPGRLEPEILYAALIRLLDLEAELKKPPVSVVRREGTDALTALNQTVFDRTRGILDLYAVAGILAGAMMLNQLVLRHVNLGSVMTATAYVLRAQGRLPLPLTRSTLS